MGLTAPLAGAGPQEGDGGTMVLGGGAATRQPAPWQVPLPLSLRSRHLPPSLHKLGNKSGKQNLQSDSMRGALGMVKSEN